MPKKNDEIKEEKNERGIHQLDEEERVNREKEKIEVYDKLLNPPDEDEANKKSSGLAKAMAGIAAGAVVAGAVTMAVLVTTDDELESHTISFDYNIDMEDIYKSEEISVGARVGDLVPKKVRGYKFMGWFKDENFTEPYSDDDIVPTNATIYGKYLPIYKVNFPTGDECVGYSIVAEDVDIVLGDNYSFEVKLLYSHSKSPVKVYLTRGEEDREELTADANGKYTITNIESHCTIEVEGIILNTYTVTFKNGVNVLKKETITHNEFAIGDEIETPTKEHHTFIGWGVTTDKDELINLSEYSIKEDTILHAKFEQLQYTVQFVSGNDDLSRYDFTYGGGDYLPSNLSLPTPTPDKASTSDYFYVFAGWSLTEDGEVITDFSQVQIVGDTKLYAVYTEYSVFNVTLNIAGSENTYQMQVGGNLKEQINNLLTNSIIDTTDENSIGWYYDEDFLNPVLSEDSVPYQVTLYTRYATLDKITITDGVASALDSTIEGEVYLPACVRTVGEFVECSSLTSVYIPYGVETISDYAFKETTLDYVNIPSSVTTIGGYAFYESLNFTHLVIPESVTSIGEAAFTYNESLESVDFSANVSSISDHIFEYCSNLKEINISSGVVSIGYAFDGCTNLSFTIPATVTEITGFSQFNYIKEFKIHQDNKYFIEEDGVIFNADKKVLYYYLPSNTRSEYVIPDGVEIIAYAAFSDNTTLESITIPASVTTIEDWAFDKWEDVATEVLKTVTFAENSKLEYIGMGAFCCNYNLTEIVIPASVKAIDEGTFDGCELTSLTFEEGSVLEYIGGYAFGYNYLTEVTIPASVEDIGHWALYGENLTSVTFENPNNWILWGYSVLPDLSDSSIAASYLCGDYREYWWSRATEDETIITVSINAEEKVFDVEKDMKVTDFLQNLYEWNWINEEQLNADWYLDDTYTTLLTEDMTITENMSIYTLIPTTDKIIIDENGYASAASSSISGVVVLPIGVKGIAENGFHSSTKVTKVIIPNTVEEICANAFAGMGWENSSSAGVYTSLSEVVFLPGSTCTTIGEMAFYDCKNLTSITIPASVMTIGAGAFGSCYSSGVGTVIIEGEGTWMNENDEIITLENGVVKEFKSGAWRRVIVEENEAIISLNKDTLGVSTYTVEKGTNILSFIESLNLDWDENDYLGWYLDEYCTIPVTEDTTAEDLTVVYTKMTTWDLIEVDSYGVVTKKDGVSLMCATIVLPRSARSISDYAFTDCTLYGIYLNEGLISIGVAAFEANFFKSLHIPSTVQTIGDRAFNGASNGTMTITFADNIQSLTIGYKAFDGCYPSEIKIPKGVVSIGEGAFSVWDNIHVDDENEYYCDIDGVLYNKDKTILMCCPTNRNQYIFLDSVHTISSDAFKGCGLTTITIPASVQTMGGYAFMVNVNLTEVIFEDNSQLTAISLSAFSGCSSLESIVLPSSITTIGLYAFSGCSSLTSIVIPSSVMRIENCAFSGTSLQNATIEIDDNDVWTYSVGILTAQDLADTSLVANKLKTYVACVWNKVVLEENQSILSVSIDGSRTNYIVDNNTNITTYINSQLGLTDDDYCGWYLDSDFLTPLTDDTIITSTMTIYTKETTWTKITMDENGLVSANTSSSSISGEVVLPLSAKGIADSGFYWADKITSIILPEGLETIGNSAFYACSSLQAIIIPSSLISIGDSAFGGMSDGTCSDLESITFRENSKLTTIGADAFGGCGSLTEIYIPASVTSIGELALTGFYGGPVQNIYVDENNEYYCSIDGVLYDKNVTTLIACPKNKTECIIPNSVTVISNNAFWNNKNLSSITIPASIQTIGKSAFSGNNLTEIIFAEGSQLIEIGDSAFSSCRLLESIILPSKVTTIGKSAFGSCSKLTSIEIPSGVTSLSSNLFQYCSALKNIVLPSSITSLGNDVFYNCTSLETITIPESVIIIEDSAFAGCSALTSVILPSGITRIESYTFDACTYLNSVTIPASVTFIGSNAFKSCSRLTSAIVEGGDWWSVGGYVLTEDEISSTSTLAKYLRSTYVAKEWEKIICEENQSILNISIVSGDYLGYYIVDNETNLSEYISTLDLGLTDDDYCGWYLDSSLTIPLTSDTVITENMTIYTKLASTDITIDENGLASASSTSISGEVVLPLSAKGIADSGFASCTSVTSVFMLSSVTTIGSQAFNGCTKLTKITIPASVSEIGIRAFGNCQSLTTIDLSEDNTNFCMEDDIIYNADKSVLIYGINKSRSVAISEGVVEIYGGAFEQCKKLTGVTFPSTLTTIGEYAFYNCTLITSITIPASVNRIDAYAFMSSGITSATFENSKGWLVSADANTEGEYLMSSSTYLSSVTFSAYSLKYSYISRYAYRRGNYYWTQRLVDVNVVIDGESTTQTVSDYKILTTLQYNEIDGLTTSNCAGLYYDAEFTNPVTSDDVWTAGMTVYARMATTDKITISSRTATCASTDIEGEVILPLSVTKIGSFNGCANITSIVIPSNVTSITGSAFMRCSSLQKVEFIGESKLKTIGVYAFYNCNALTEFEMPSSVTTIGSLSFYHVSLTEINISSAVTSIGGQAFIYCQKLTAINVDSENTTYSSENGVLFDIDKTRLMCYPAGKSDISAYEIPSTVVTIDADGFAYCQGLNSVTIPNGVVSIGTNAFQWTGINTDVFIPASVETLTGDVFQGAGLKAINVDENNAYYCSVDGVLYNKDKTTLMKCGRGLTMDTLVIPEGVELIEDWAFYGCNNIGAWTLPSTLKTIENDAFRLCLTMKSIVIPSSVTRIDKDAFVECRNLTSVTFADPSNWFLGDSSTATSGTDLDATTLSDTSTAATYLVTDYVSSYWLKKENE